MEIKKELIENDIHNLEVQLEQAKASVNQIAGAIATLKGMVAYMEKPEPEPEQGISDANKAVQDELEAKKKTEEEVSNG